jgi:hypothetical protein
VFGLAWAATPVTAQSYVADMTFGEAERVRGISTVGAAQAWGSARPLGPTTLQRTTTRRETAANQSSCTDNLWS